MKRDILKIVEEHCNGCGQYVPICHKGSMQVKNGIIKLVQEAPGSCLMKSGFNKGI
jgi:ferredoxin